MLLFKMDMTGLQRKRETKTKNIRRRDLDSQERKMGITLIQQDSSTGLLRRPWAAEAEATQSEAEATESEAEAEASHHEAKVEDTN